MSKEHTPSKKSPQPGEDQATQDEQMFHIVNNENADPDLRRIALSALWDSAGIRAKRRESENEREWDGWASWEPRCK